MFANTIEKNNKEILQQNVQIKYPQHSDLQKNEQVSSNFSQKSQDQVGNDQFKRSLQKTQDEQENQTIQGGYLPELRLSRKEVRKKIQNFKPFTHSYRILSENQKDPRFQLNGEPQLDVKNYNSRNQMSPTARFQVLKNTFIIQISLILAQSRIDEAFTLVGRITKGDIPQSLRNQGVTLPSQIFNQMSRNKDQLQVNHLLNLKIVITGEEGSLTKIRKYRFPLSQKTLSFQEQYLKKMHILQQQNHRLQYQISQIALQYEDQLQQEREITRSQRQQKQKLSGELNQYKKVDMENLVEKDMMDLDGIIEVTDKQKYKPTVAIQQDIQEITQGIKANQIGYSINQISGNIVDIERMSLQKSYDQTVKNHQYLKLIQTIQKISKNSTSIDKSFISLMIDIVVDEDRKNGSKNVNNYPCQKQKGYISQSLSSCNLNNLNESFFPIKNDTLQRVKNDISIPVKERSVDLSSYEHKITMISNKTKSNRILLQESSSKQSLHKPLSAKNGKKQLKKVDNQLKDDQNKQRIQSQLKQFLFGIKQTKSKEITTNNSAQLSWVNKIQLNQKIDPFKSLKQKRKTRIGKVTEIQSIQYQEQGQLAKFNGDRSLKDDQIQFMQKNKQCFGTEYLNRKTKNKQQQDKKQIQILEIFQTSQSKAISKQTSKLNLNLYQLGDDDSSIEVLNLDQQKQIFKIGDEVLNNGNNNPSAKYDFVPSMNGPSKKNSQLCQRVPKQKNQAYISKIVPPKQYKSPKPLILNLNHNYKGQNPEISEQEYNQLLGSYEMRFSRPRRPKVYQTQQYAQKKQIWMDYAKSLDTNDLVQLLNEPDYGSVHKIFKSDKLIGTLAFAQLFYNVRLLDLAGNNITYIQGLQNLRRIQKLDLSKNLITKMQNLQGQINMRQLYLRQNKIQLIENIFHMNKLDTLALQDNNIFQINDKLGDIGALRYLYIERNRIKKLRSSLKSLRLMAIKIHGNGMNYEDPTNKEIIQYIRSTHCSVHLEDFI